MSFEIRYLADDGEIRWVTVEADSAEEAISIALKNDFGNYSGDAISEIISVE